MISKIEPAKTSIAGFDIPLEDLYKRFNIDPKTGLSEHEAKQRLATYGENVIPKVKPSLIQVYIAPLLEVMIVVYLIMAAFLVILTIWDSRTILQASQWVAIVVLNFVIAIVQQARAQKKMDALQKLSAATATVVRGGKTSEIETSLLVPGDIIQLGQGDSIPADARIISSGNLIVNEASLTGESVPINKIEDGTIKLPRDTPIGERINMIYKGTFVQIGNATAVVVNTGRNTEIGNISTELAELNTGEIPLRAKVNTLGKYLTVAMIFFLSISLIYRYFQLSNQHSLNNITDVVQNLVASIITAMSLMPINIPLLTTIVLITGVLAMATHRVVIRNLSAIESLGRISVLCSDKTGTITRSQMTVKRIWDGSHLYGVTGLGYGPNGVIFPIPNKVTAELEESFVPDELFVASEKSSLELMLISGEINNEAEIIVEDVFESSGQTTWKATGSPTDAALLALFEKSGLEKTEILSRYREIKTYPFDSSVKRMSKLILDSKTNEYLVFTKGAIEMLIGRCSRIGSRDKTASLTPEKRKEIHEFANSFAALGFRILTLCFKQIPALPKKSDDEREEVENDLILLGFVCLLDPPREGVKESVNECLNAGIVPIMITGDSPVTAATIAREIDIIHSPDHLVYVGKMASLLTDDEFFRTRVFARVAPKDKQVIVERYQKRNKVVAMTGDGVNDALALSMSDAGICMGITGTDVAKQAADLVITDDSFNSIVTGIREGRGLFQKIRIMIFFYIGVNFAEALLYFGTTFFPGIHDFLLFNNWQRIYNFAIAHSLPPLAIIFDWTSGDIMRRTPLDTAGIFNKQMLIALILMGVTLSLGGYIVYFSAFYNIIPVNSVNMSVINLLPVFSSSELGHVLNWQQAKARTMLHTVLFIAESTLVLSIRRMDMSIIDSSFKSERFWLAWVAVLSLPAVHLIMMYVTPLQQGLFNLGVLFEVIPLDPVDWIICLIFGFLPIVVLEYYKYFIRQ